MADVDLLSAGTTWADEEIRDTAIAQPLLTAAALLSARALLGGSTPDAVCGHSIGELPALAIAGVLTEDEAISLATVRGRAMAAATRLTPTGMAAVLGGDPAVVLAESRELSLEVATINVAGQMVVGGSASGIDALVAAPPGGARVRRLDVAGAFHTSAMSTARAPFEAALAALAPRPPITAVIANADGAVVESGRDALDRLAVQVTSVVRFDLCLETMATLGVRGSVEVAPGGTLTAVAKRGLPGVETVALRTPDDFPAARALLPHAGEHQPVTWRALPSPENGVVDQLIELGGAVDAGTPIAVVSGRSGASTVVAPVPGTLTEWLVTAGDPVRAGQLLAVLS